MQYVGSLRVMPQLPEELNRLKDLAYNLYFTWHPEVRDLFINIDRKLWKQVNHNPVKFLHEVQQKKIEQKKNDPEFLRDYRSVVEQFDTYINEKNTWFNKNYREYRDKIITYFTAEFGFHESLPIYAGGLGVLAGDHLKSASDLGIPVAGISLFYDQTYFTQEIDVQGNQISHYRRLNPDELPLTLVQQRDGSPLLVKVPLANREVLVRIWRAQVGRNSAFLLDTNLEQNRPLDREITSRLYGGDQEMRISQEIVLGMGGVLALEAMGIQPSVWHMNEGHSVFLTLQRIKQLVQEKKLKFGEALEAVTANTIFTTHTPVPAGNDAFPLDIKDKYFQKYWELMGIGRHQFMELGSQVQPEGYEIFNLTILALNLSRHRNGVSQLHGKVSRKLWSTVWPHLPEHEVPIDNITNGVHSPSWLSRKVRQMLEKQFKDSWQENQDNEVFWQKVAELPDEVWWQVKLEMKEKLLNHVKERLEIQFKRSKIGSLQMRRIKKVMQPEVLTIGFARRFATYKRATLIFRDIERLRRLVNDPEHPLQIIFAGKAHPKDSGGQELIRQIYNYSLSSDFRGKIVFVENYDMGLARDLTAGVDVWLNNPLRTQEASGTSGQKVGMNAGINFSVLDGWWSEGCDAKNGWAFGDKEDFGSREEWDAWDSEELYDILENEIIPLYYKRNEKGLPTEWINVMKNSMTSILPRFNTHRMIKEYWQKKYLPAIQLEEKFKQDEYSVARELASWLEKIEHNWYDVGITAVRSNHHSPSSEMINFGEHWEIDAEVKLGSLEPSDVKVQLFLTRKSVFGDSEPVHEVFDMEMQKKEKNGKFHYRVIIQPSDSGNYVYTFRVVPFHEHLINPLELGLAKWYQLSAGENLSEIPG